MQPGDWESVRAIYIEGIATGNATFEKTAPEWEVWNDAHLSFCRFVARKDSAIVGWAALTPYSRRPVYAGIVDQDLKRLGGSDSSSRHLDVGDVEHQRIGPVATFADRVRGFVDFSLGPRCKRDMRAGRRQRRSSREPDAATGTGNQRALAVEAEGWSICQLDWCHCIHRSLHPLPAQRGEGYSFRRLRVGDIAAAVAADADIGLLGMRDKAFKHAQP